MNVESGGYGPFPCACGRDAVVVLVVIESHSFGCAVVSGWFCQAHSPEAISMHDKAESIGWIAALYDAEDASDEIRNIETLLGECVREMESDYASLRQAPASTESRATRRARASGRHRQRSRGRVAPSKRSNGQGPPKSA